LGCILGGLDLKAAALFHALHFGFVKLASTVETKMSWMVLCKLSERDIARKQPTEFAALKDACSLVRQGYTVNQIVGPSKTIKAQQIWDWCREVESEKGPQHSKTASKQECVAISAPRARREQPPVSLKRFFIRGLEKSSEAERSFSLMRLEQENPGLACHFLWDRNPMFTESGELWLHLGCGVRVFEGFVNLDICPQDMRVIRWNLLDLWPQELDEKVEGVFSEDCIEHFFHAEQTYILCNVNRALKPTRVARILMPSLAKLVDQYPTYRPDPHDYMYNTHGVETGGDAVNYAMRFQGHRWLHDPRSLTRMSALCGFEATATDCARSDVPKFNGLNLRDESSGSLSFANDLRKTRCISRVLVSPAAVKGATKVEDLAPDAALFVTTSERPVVEYSLPHSMASSSVVCINFRSSNLSSFEWGLKTLVIDDINRAKPWYFDETLKSQPCMNLITKSQLKLVLGGAREFSRLNFSPAANCGEYFTLGGAEVFIIQ
jgi:predicted SAM-dependent methyltransferase